MLRRQANYSEYERVFYLQEKVSNHILAGEFVEADRCTREMEELTDRLVFNKKSPIGWKHFLKRT